MTWGWTHISSPQWSPTESKTNYVEKPSIQIQNSRASCRQLELAMLNILGWAPSSAGFYWHVWFSLFCKVYLVENKPVSNIWCQCTMCRTNQIPGTWRSTENILL